MATDPDFGSQLSIESIITAPLVAVSKANVVMITGQTRALLDNCFSKKQDSDTYEPVMINMTLTRSSLETDTGNAAAGAGGESGGLTGVKSQTMTFAVPLLCLIPINNIVVDKATVEFDMEITSVSHWEMNTDITGEEGKPIMRKQAVLNGKITNKTGDGTTDRRSSSRLKVNINAGPLPLSVGLLTVLDLYSKSIQPVLPAEEPKKLNA